MPPVAAFALACLLIPLLFGGKAIEFRDAALPEGTSSVFASVDGIPIHVQMLDEAEQGIAGAMQRIAGKRILWLGNSQLHAVNQYVEGQETAALVLHHRLRAQDADLFTFSYPNINLQECYAVFEYLRTRLPMDVLILPVVYDDTREDGVGGDFAAIFADGPTVSHLERTRMGRAMLVNRVNSEGMDAFAGIRRTTQERVEKHLDSWLAHHSRIWELRPQARGKLFLYLHYLRNFVFRITAQTKRPMIPGRYALNMEALHACLSVAAEAKIKTLVYIVPLRRDVAIPYVQSEYDAFKKDIANAAQNHGAIFADMEDVVPAEFWGQKESTTGGKNMELDFMHFKAEGHRLLAEQLWDILQRENLVETTLTQ
ncbi:MAG: hypothetical protein IH624_01945 [Phycisphaerae bacterium]|nr:hypothetical protein [Phycisphaerae bacterium]